MALQQLIYLILFTCLMIYFGQAFADSENVGETRAATSDLSAESGRTFGAIKKFQTALLPIMYKLGVMSAVIMMTLFLAFKGVFIGTLILVLNLIFFAVKFGSLLKSSHHHSESYGWQPQVSGHGWSPQKDVHLHIHNGHGKPDYSIPYSSYPNIGNTNAGWDPNTAAIESQPPHWSSYAHQGRQLTTDSDLTGYSSNTHISTEKLNQMNSKVFNRKSDKPIIVTGETIPIVSPNSPYNYIRKQNVK